MQGKSASEDENDGPGRPAGLVGSVVQALAILRYVAAHSEPLRVSTVARELKLNPSTCFNILKTLAAEGFIERDDRTKTYVLGAAPLDLARHVLEDGGVFPYIRAAMQECAEAFSVTTTLWRRTRNDRWVLIGLTESRALARIYMTVGQRLPLYGGAMGRCLAAQEPLSPSEIMNRVRAIRWHRPLGAEEYLNEVEQAQRRGWALDENGFNPFFSSIAAPIIDDSGQVRYCVTQTMFAGQHSPIEIEGLGEATLRIADHASRNIYGRRASAAADRLIEPLPVE